MILNELNEIKDHFCIGCGICAESGYADISFDEFGKYKAKLKKINENNVDDFLKGCPFSSLIENEDVLADELFGNHLQKRDDIIGYYINNYIGHVVSDDIRMNASSGGIISWILTELLENKLITHAAHVGKSISNKSFSEYKISKSKKEIIEGASSKYYPVKIDLILSYIKSNPGEYAIVALPCFVKGIRALQKNNKIFRKRIKYIISPFCGHLKTKNYVSFLAMQKKISFNNIKKVNFRKKISGYPASQYGTEFYLQKEDKEEIAFYKNTEFKMGTNWGHGMFKYPVCDYCDDIVGELADISVGDAWLKEYEKDYKGNSVFCVRNEEIENIIKQGQRKNEIKTELIDPLIVRESQAGGIRNKREDLAYRLYLKSKRREWYPLKRVKPSKQNIGFKRRLIIKMRIQISDLSHTLFLNAVKNNQIDVFYKKISPILKKYEFINKVNIKNIKAAVKKRLGLNKKERNIS